MAKLLPCPFCGGEAENDFQQAYRAIQDGRIDHGAAVYCTRCDANMIMCRGDHPELSDEERMAVMVEDWNRRAAAPPQPTERVSDTPSAALEAPLNSFEIEVLEMLAGKRDGQWGAWVGAVLGTLSGRGLCTRGPNYQITDSGRAAVEASHE